MNFIFTLQNNFLIFFLDFYEKNPWILLFFFVIYLGILWDPRFPWKNKIFFFFYFLFFIFLISFHSWTQDSSFEAPLCSILGEIFWYTLILNGSFILHICILDWIYQLFKYLKKDYLCFLVTRISFVLSLSFLLFLKEILYLRYVRSRLPCHETEDDEPYNIYTEYKGRKLVYLVHLLWKISEGFSAFFMRLFHQYSLLMLGLIKIEKFNWKLVLKFILILLISYLILGIPRIYVIWLIYLVNFLWARFFSEIKNYQRYIDRKLIEYKYNIYYLDFLRFIILRFPLSLNGPSWNLRKNYKKINSRGFSSSLLYFVDCRWTYYWFFKNPFIYYQPQRMVIWFLKVWYSPVYYWKYTISEENLQGSLNAFIQELDLDLEPSEYESLKKKVFFLYRNALIKSNKPEKLNKKNL